MTNRLLSVYSLFFSDRVRLLLHDIISSCRGHFLCRSQVLSCTLLHSPTMSFLLIQPVFCLQLYTPYISSPSPLHFSSSQPTTSNDSCDRLNSNQLSQFFTCTSVFQRNTTHPSASLEHMSLVYSLFSR